MNVAFGYPYKLERQSNGWWLVRFPDIPEALTEGENRQEAMEAAEDCLITALEGYMKAGRSIPRPPFKGERIILPSLVTAKLAVYVNMQKRGWSKVKLADELGMPENSVRRLLDLRHSSHLWIIDEAMQKMNDRLSIDLPRSKPRGKAA
ncbi:MAG TPA: type II toxin-antitoxin system HicB family antitoxin [Rhizomicrobium sp.]|jgi:antitoxin HicB